MSTPELGDSPLTHTSPVEIEVRRSPLEAAYPPPRGSPTPPTLWTGPADDAISPETRFATLSKITRTKPAECSDKIDALMSNKPLFASFLEIIPMGAFYHLAGINYEQLARMGDLPTFDKARKYFSISISNTLEPKFQIRARLRIAFTYSYDKQFPLALAHLKEIEVEAIPATYLPHYYYHLAEALLETEAADEAIPYFEALVGLDCQRNLEKRMQQNGRHQLAKLFDSNGDHVKAFEAAKAYLIQGKGLIERSKIGELCLIVAKHYQTTENTIMVERFALKGLVFKSEASNAVIARLHYTLLSVYMLTNNRTEAMRYCALLDATDDLEALLAAPNMTSYLFASARLFLDDREIDETLKIVKRILKRDLTTFKSIHTSTTALLAIIEAKKGNYEAASVTFNSLAIETISIPRIKKEAIEMYYLTQYELRAQHFETQIASWTLGGGMGGRMTVPFRLQLGQKLIETHYTYGESEKGVAALIDTYRIAIEHGELSLFISLIRELNLLFPIIEVAHLDEFSATLMDHQEELASIEVDAVIYLINQAAINPTDSIHHECLLWATKVKYMESHCDHLKARLYYALGWLQCQQEVVNHRKVRLYFTLCTAPLYRPYLSDEELALASAHTNRIV